MMLYIATIIKTLKATIPLWKQLKHLRGQRGEVLNQLNKDGFGEPLELARLYVDPDCQPHSPTEYNDDDIAQFRKPIFEEIDTFLGKKTYNRDGQTQLFILSDAGMGKTSLLTMIRLKHLLNFWQPLRGTEVRLLKLGEETLKQLKQVKNPANTLLLLDALDEDRLARKDIDSRLQDLLQASKPFHHVIISCRTQFFPRHEQDPARRQGWVVVGSFTCPVLYLSLFNNTQVASYLEKKFPDHWYQFSGARKKTLAQRDKAKNLLSHMDSLQFRPMLLNYIDQLMSSENRHWNLYTVYQTLIDYWLLREEKKLDELYEELPIKDRPKREHLLKACIQMAFAMQNQSKETGQDVRTLNKTALDSLIKKTDFNISYLKDFEFGGRALLNRNAHEDYRFSHYSIQEYLLAHGICCGYLTRHDSVAPTEEIIRFLRLTGMNEAKLRILDMNITDYAQQYGSFQDALNQGGKDYGLGPVWLPLPAGTFRMGDMQGIGYGHERPVHPVEVDAFGIAIYPVTVGEFAAFVQATNYQTTAEREGSAVIGIGKDVKLKKDA
ncbi:SUMF1/EgtB/PvdO family nonheme iron enzyme, partial [Candidatus Venteria ishoeyi]